MKHLLINLVLLLIVIAFLFYRFAEYLALNVLKLSNSIDVNECDNHYLTQLDLFSIKRKLLS